MKILNVHIVQGRTLHNNWRLPVQIISTSEGEFIDSMPRSSYNCKRGLQQHGYDWSELVGYKLDIAEFYIVQNSGFNWLKHT